MYRARPAKKNNRSEGEDLQTTILENSSKVLPVLALGTGTLARILGIVIYKLQSIHTKRVMSSCEEVKLISYEVGLPLSDLLTSARIAP